MYNKEYAESKTRLYTIWIGMKSRCYNPKYPHYKRYGGRGLTVYFGWKDDYLAFKSWAISNGYIDTLTIDRIDNDKGYQPDNCRWITRSDNTKKVSRDHAEDIDNINQAFVIGFNLGYVAALKRKQWS